MKLVQNFCHDILKSIYPFLYLYTGRGGSDGCKVPMKIDSLQGLGVCKVECGSQFSVALTKSGAVYTW